MGTLLPKRMAARPLSQAWELLLWLLTMLRWDTGMTQCMLLSEMLSCRMLRMSWTRAHVRYDYNSGKVAGKRLRMDCALAMDSCHRLGLGWPEFFELPIRECRIAKQLVQSACMDKNTSKE